MCKSSYLPNREQNESEFIPKKMKAAIKAGVSMSVVEAEVAAASLGGFRAFTSKPPKQPKGQIRSLAEQNALFAAAQAAGMHHDQYEQMLLENKGRMANPALGWGNKASETREAAAPTPDTSAGAPAATDPKTGFVAGLDLKSPLVLGGGGVVLLLLIVGSVIFFKK